ncbi:MAG TPA: putative inorganic carbon transporter subunit DabA, partial [Candidatus Methylomirabilis sp.]|nr:putative inorganic carbon transporter subunit DabA [Candidatus Methylomirabilis sp.]
GALRDRLVPPLQTSLRIERSIEGDARGRLATHGPDQILLGFSPEEQVDVVEGQLRMIGLTRQVARLVLFCAHGSTTENNPYAAAYHCGACGGNRGGPNGRAIAAMANNPMVRTLLRKRGIEIPDDTHFLGGEHDTAADRFAFFDTEDIPDTHREEFRRFERDIQYAAALHAQERCRYLPLAPEHPTPEQALRHVQNRTLDWAQVYPEWGHATCALMLIGRRELTRGLFLDRRAYLQSYDPDQDPDGAILQEIMSAFIPVVRGISLDYYFSYVDSGINGVFGAGTKAIHNVVGLIGVMQGAGGDLKPGLPAQGVAPLHEPMRAQIIVESSPARVALIVEQNKVLENLFKHQWAYLIVRDPETREFMGYRPDGTWEALHAGHRS